MLGSLFGIKIYEDNNLTLPREVTEHFRLKRNRGVWVTRKRIVHFPDPNYYQVKATGDIICHPVKAQELRDVVAKQTQSSYDRAIRQAN